jgi:hypothetical protein
VYNYDVHLKCRQLFEEKTNDYDNFEKGMIYMKILKKGGGGSREKGGGGNEIHAPCACAFHVKQ